MGYAAMLRDTPILTVLLAQIFPDFSQLNFSWFDFCPFDPCHPTIHDSSIFSLTPIP